MSEARFRFLSQEDVVAAGGLDVAATIDVVEEALRLHAEGDTRLPTKSALLWSDELGSEETDGRIMAMPDRPQNSRLQFSHRKTRPRTFRLWPPHRGHRRHVPATAQSIGSVVSPG